MLVYGDRTEHAELGERLAALSPTLNQIAGEPAGIDRHARLVGALVEGGQLLQGAADAQLETAQLDDFLYRLARCVLGSWDSGFSILDELPSVPRLEGQVEVRVPEGFAFYAVYPETYAKAARALGLNGRPRVIGIRSIGTTLAAIAAAALRAPPPVTVRPHGHPFARRVDMPEEVIESDAHYVIVDEGPGLSGSSFGAVADWLESRGVPLSRIAFLPSHSGDVGPKANEAHRRRWHAAQRIAATFDPSFLEQRFGRLEAFATGSPGERLKYRGATEDGRVLLKFAGLGHIGEHKLQLARALHSAGLTPEPLGLAHGFLIERWNDDASPLGADERPVEEIGRYIGARARLLPAGRGTGATIAELQTMCRRNISLAFGENASRAVDQFAAAELSARVSRARTDNKLDRNEWLRLPDERLLKSDALDHHQAHDLVGCQDIAWDIAGAIVEFNLDGPSTRQLIVATGRRVDALLLNFYRVAYPAFRLGQAVIDGDRGNAGRYRRTLDHVLHELNKTEKMAQTAV